MRIVLHKIQFWYVLKSIYLKMCHSQPLLVYFRLFVLNIKYNLPMSRFKPRFVMMEATAQPIVSKPFTCLLFDLRQKHIKLLYLSPAISVTRFGEILPVWQKN